MSQQEYDAFVRWLREWMEAHPEEYAAFEAEMNRMDGAGYRRIMAVAISFVPKYRKAVERKMETDGFEDITDLETMLSGANIGDKLLTEIENPTDSTVPNMLCWLYFGRSFENMIEMGEELMPAVSRFQQFSIAFTTKLLISRSISLGFRTKQDWGEYNKLKKAIDTNRISEWVLPQEELTSDPVAAIAPTRKPGRKKTELSLLGMFSSAVPNKKVLSERIGQWLVTGRSESDLARLKIAHVTLSSLTTTILIQHIITYTPLLRKLREEDKNGDASPSPKK